MKKLFLLGALVCAGQMYGMEKNPWEELPTEIQREIVNTALVTNKSVDDVINTIKAFGTLYGVHYDTQTATDLLMKTLPNDLDQAIDKTKNLQGATLEDFTKLVHVLADKFNTTTEKVAKKFTTPIADTYVQLGRILLGRMSDRIVAATYVSQLIKEGADINFSGALPSYEFMKNNIGSPLSFAIEQVNATAVEVLLRPGIKITNDDLHRAEVLSQIPSEEIKDWRPGAKGDEAKIIYKLLLKAKNQET